MINLFPSRWLALVLLGTAMYMGATVALLKPENLEGTSAKSHEMSSKHQMSEPFWNHCNPEMEQGMAKFQERGSLKEMELPLQLQTDCWEKSTVTQVVQRLQKEFEQNVLSSKEGEAEKWKKLAKMYGGMDPEVTANIFREMPDDDVVKVLPYLKADEVDAILKRINTNDFKIWRY